MSAFDGKVALVTGAASGIGLAVSRQLIQAGAKVVGADISEDNLNRAAADMGPNFAPAITDVRIEEQVIAAAAIVQNHFGGMHLGFNIAGASSIGAITDMDESTWDFTVDVVLKGTFLCTKHEGRRITETGGGGAIINVASLNAHVPMELGSSYAAAKAGVEMFSKNAALELAAHDIRVNAVLPGLVDTPMTSPLLGIGRVREDFMNRIPMRRAARPEEIADVCLYLAGDRASYVTGTSLVVDGGWEITNYPPLSLHLAALAESQ